MCFIYDCLLIEMDKIDWSDNSEHIGMIYIDISISIIDGGERFIMTIS